MTEPTKRLYLDLDGVMADFDAHFPATFDLDHRSMADDAMWERINAHPSYFRDMPPCPGAIEFFRSIEHLRPIILTACPKSNYPHVAAQKRAWVREHLSKHVTVLPVLGGHHKPLFMQEPGDVLIDDWHKNTAAWTAAGGISILHWCFDATRDALAKHFPATRSTLPSTESMVATARMDRIWREMLEKGTVLSDDFAWMEKGIRAAIKAGVADRSILECSGCGSREEIEAIQARGHLSCCPERKMVSVGAFPPDWRSAFLLVLTFADHAAGDGWEIHASEDTGRPRLDSADLCIGAAEALGLDYAGPEFLALTDEAYRAVAARNAAKQEA